jgi:2-(1,2-epoxy-1,2-dihydrophenyl)acetyl-CoA isomerase
LRSEYEHILHDVTDRIATLTLNRPDKLNAYIPEMGDEVVDAFRSSVADPSVHVIVLTGAGRGFCAGVDLEVLKASYSKPPLPGAPKLGEEDFIRKLPLEIETCEKPVIAAINGHAIGVGVTMCLPCDIRIAAEDAKIGLTFAKLGILPGLGSTHLLPALVGAGRARELVLTGRILRGREAEQIGLVERAGPPETVIEVVGELATTLAGYDPTVLASAKRALREGASLSLPDAMQNEQRLSAELRAKRGGGTSS